MSACKFFVLQEYQKYLKIIGVYIKTAPKLAALKEANAKVSVRSIIDIQL